MTPNVPNGGRTLPPEAVAAKGATVVSVCEGARVLAHAGLLNGRRASTGATLDALPWRDPRDQKCALSQATVRAATSSHP